MHEHRDGRHRVEALVHVHRRFREPRGKLDDLGDEPLPEATATTAFRILQEAITLLVFMGFAWLSLGETPTWRHLLSFALIFAAVAITFNK